MIQVGLGFRKQELARGVIPRAPEGVARVVLKAGEGRWSSDSAFCEVARPLRMSLTHAWGMRVLGCAP